MQYLRAVLGQIPAFDGKGLIRLPCALGSHLGCYILLDPRTGQWHSRGNCDRGDLFDYAALRFKIFDPRQAQAVVLGTIREAQEKADLAEQAIREERTRSKGGLAPWISKLCGLIDRYSGRDKQRAHLGRSKFRKALRERHTYRHVYFPIISYGPPDVPDISAVRMVGNESDGS